MEDQEKITQDQNQAKDKPKDNDVHSEADKKQDKVETKTEDVVSKLKDRLNKKTAENSSLADQVADLRVQLQKFTQQDKANDEQASELDEAKKQLEALQLENQRIKASRQVEKDLQDAGLLSYSSDGVLEDVGRRYRQSHNSTYYGFHQVCPIFGNWYPQGISHRAYA